MNISGILASFSDAAESSPQTSVTSELTFMTYSDERAQILKQRFIRRIQQEQVTRELSLAERKAILQELQEEQQAEQQKKRWKSVTSKNDSEQFKMQDQLPEQLEEHRRNTSHPYYEEEEKSCSADVTEVEDEVMETKSNGCRRRRSISFSSKATTKRRNSNHDCSDSDEEPSEEETNSPSLIPDELEYNHQASPPNWTQQSSAEADIENIGEIIKLKLLVANQQATMDTLSSKLHNMELANRQQENMDQSRIHSLEVENQCLAEQLNEYQERDIGSMIRMNRVLDRSSRDKKMELEDGRMQFL